MEFIDEAKIEVRAGRGGNGCLSFRREKYVPRGGPDGGDGGDGGSVILVVNQNLNTLLDYRYRHHYVAKNGKHGRGKKMHGRTGENVELKVPPGTTVYDDKGALLCDLLHPGERFVIAKGGRGGRGNAHFATPTNRTPTKFEPGEEGEKRIVKLELRLIADVGIVGYPNSGKSTLLKSISAASPKVADYPFTTLSPNLGVVDLVDFERFVVADIPGIIEGAHLGKGMGLEFLRHIERTRLLVFLIDVSKKDSVLDYQRLKAELNTYDPELMEKPKILVFNKVDLLDEVHRSKIDDSLPVFYISALLKKGLEPLLKQMQAMLEES